MLHFDNRLVLPDNHPLEDGFIIIDGKRIVQNRLWIRRTGRKNSEGGLLLVPWADTRSRNLNTLCWGEKSKFATRAAWVSTVGDEFLIEVVQLLNRAGTPLLGKPGKVGANVIREFMHGPISQSVTAPSVPDALNTFWAEHWVVSQTPYRAAPSEWLTVGDEYLPSEFIRQISWDYDIAEGTPSGQYDFRPFYLGDEYPPPAKPAPIGCFRWVPNTGYDPTAPWSPPYFVYRYHYSITGEPPADFPMGGSWDSIETPSTVDAKSNNQSVVLYAPTIRYLEDEDIVLLALQKRFTGSIRWRYRYICSMTTIRQSAPPTTDPAAKIQLDEMRWKADGLRVIKDGSVVYDDGPITAIGRYNADASFPLDWRTDDGYFLISPKSRTLRGLHTIRAVGFTGDLDEYRRFYNRTYPKDGDFWGLISERAKWTNPPIWKVVRANAEFVIPNPQALNDESEFAVWISEDDDGRAYFMVV